MQTPLSGVFGSRNQGHGAENMDTLARLEFGDCMPLQKLPQARPQHCYAANDAGIVQAWGRRHQLRPVLPSRTQQSEASLKSA